MSDVLIADDHSLFRDALPRSVLNDVSQAQVHHADSLPALLVPIDAFPDAELLLPDLHMPGARGYSARAHIRGQYPGLPTVVVSGHEEAQVARRALAHGAAAYIPKSTDGADIVASIHAALDGDVRLPPALLGSTGELNPDEAAAAAQVAALTPQQFRVMTMIAEGLLNKQIAWELGVSEATVKAHMTAIVSRSATAARPHRSAMPLRLIASASTNSAACRRSSRFGRKRCEKNTRQRTFISGDQNVPCVTGS